MSDGSNRGDTWLGYLPVKTLALAFLLALVYRALGLDNAFLKSNASWPNLSMGASITSFLLVFYFLSFVLSFSDDGWVGRLRALLVEFVVFSYDLSFFALGFILVFDFGKSDYWSSLGLWLPIYLVWFIFSHHALLLVNGDQGSTVRLVNYIGERKGKVPKFQCLRNRSFYGLLGILCVVIFIGAAVVAKNYK
ncbi:hypothetical protein I5S53_10555 [Pseudomonas juntendi]|uniref:hypothetical protein n=1 Tax=Pseudomonas TaxID=286 RepID=UPI000D95DD92|nr:MULTISPECIES: hypothetical protein [Pseudomonas]MBH3384401.1 hypothetical protein [Pseudomonas juntendi]PYC09082.1 hypothetical protein DMX12_02290 [Pseudomonas sp. MB-090624]